MYNCRICGVPILDGPGFCRQHLEPDPNVPRYGFGGKVKQETIKSQSLKRSKRDAEKEGSRT